MNELPPDLKQPVQTPSLLQPRPVPAWRRWWFWIAILVLAIAGVYAWRTINAKPAEADAAPAGQAGAAGGRRAGGGAGAGGPGGRTQAPVVVATAKTSDLSVFLNSLGAVVPLNTVIVKSRVDGQLNRVLFNEGKVVKKGDLLAEIDPRAFEVQLTQAEGQMARDQALLKNAQVDLERYKTLFQQDSIAKQQVDTQESLVRQYEGAVKVDRGQIDNAKLQLSYTKVLAPISGRAGLRQVDTGNIIHASDANGIVILTQLQPISVLFTVAEDSIPAVMKRQRNESKVPIEVWDRAHKNKLGTGLLASVDNQIDATTGMVKMKAQFSNDDAMLFPNQFVNTRMLVDVLHGVTLIPTAGVQRGSQGSFVYVLKPDSTVTLRMVKVGATEGDNTAIESGVVPGDQVVVDGADRLREGAKVEVSNRDGSARGGAGGGRRNGAAGGAGAGGANGAARGTAPAAAAGGTSGTTSATTAAMTSGTSTGAVAGATNADAPAGGRRRRNAEGTGVDPRAGSGSGPATGRTGGTNGTGG
ncbi:MAG: multidrug transporter subunit MdtA [Herminiimonas sp.]|nr:multidrug transporter subunit MdtA [Herminiimonas sp.]